MISGTCTGYDQTKICTRRAPWIVTAGCVHEHISERSLCDWHAEDVQLGLMVCGDCLDGKQSHPCKLTAQAVRKDPS